MKYASPAVERLFGCPPEQLKSLDISWIDEDHVDAITSLFQGLKAKPDAVEVADVPIRRVDGTSQWVEVRVTNLIDNPAVGGYVCNMRDIGARRNAHLQLVHDAQHDPLTHLANRRLFLERLDHAWNDGSSPAEVIAVLFIDVDHFKEINDRLGHEVGDHVLVTIANALSGLLRPTDLVARFGGDEFAVLLDPMPDLDGALEVAERIRADVSGCTHVDGHELALAVSVGVATSRDANSAATCCATPTRRCTAPNATAGLVASPTRSERLRTSRPSPGTSADAAHVCSSTGSSFRVRIRLASDSPSPVFRDSCSIRRLHGYLPRQTTPSASSTWYDAFCAAAFSLGESEPVLTSCCSSAMSTFMSDLIELGPSLWTFL